MNIIFVQSVVFLPVRVFLLIKTSVCHGVSDCPSTSSVPSISLRASPGISPSRFNEFSLNMDNYDLQPCMHKKVFI